MPLSVEINVKPEKIKDEAFIEELLHKKAKLKKKQKWKYQLVKKSLDARGNKPKFRLRFDVYIDEDLPKPNSYFKSLKPIHGKESVIVIGAGPAGYFAALKLIELGYKPIVLDRGKDVRERRRDLKAIQQKGIVNPDSNYCFGEGGAGTYSDGKLYTRSQKRGNIEEILQILVEHGANSRIMYDAHPHIGSNKLPNIISAIRETIEKFGGEVKFNTKVIDFISIKNKIVEVIDEKGRIFKGNAFVLATGHSARDIYELLYRKNIKIEAKPFALGVRIEHPQGLIDEIQYNQKKRDQNLPPASYSLKTQVEGHGVFSFCMCPGGLIVPAATAPGEIVVNGMSLSRRDSPFANSGFVTEISLEDVERMGQKGPLMNIEFQRIVEQNMFLPGDGTQQAPAARMTDFVDGKLSKKLNKSSYIPGIYVSPLHQLLPKFVYERLVVGMKKIGEHVKGFYTKEANVVGVESRTSAPVRIPRSEDTLMHEQLEGLFPCGEGAGYAGGILSACMDGQRVAVAISKYLN